MIFTVSTSILQKQLQIVNSVIGGNTTLPILEDFLFELKGNQLKISATDLETTISASLTVVAKEDGIIAIPARILLEVLKTLSVQPITFWIREETGAIQIISQSGKYKLVGDSGQDFPALTPPTTQQSFSLQSNILIKAIQKGLFAVSNDDLRPTLTGGYLQADREGITFVTTDGFKLMRYKRSDESYDQTLGFIIPRKALTLLKKALPFDVRLTISFSDNYALFSTDNLQVVCRLIEGNYPNYEAVIPLENPNKLTISRVAFLNALRRIAIFSNKTTYQVILNMSGDHLSLYAQDIDFSSEAKDKMPCTYEGFPIEIAFNAKFLVDILQVLDTEKVCVRLSSPDRAALVVPAEMELYESLLMLIVPSTFGQ